MQSQYWMFGNTENMCMHVYRGNVCECVFCDVGHEYMQSHLMDLTCIPKGKILLSHWGHIVISDGFMTLEP